MEDLATIGGFCSSVGLTDEGPLTDVKAGPWGAVLKAGICSTVDMSEAQYQIWPKGLDQVSRRWEKNDYCDGEAERRGTMARPLCGRRQCVLWCTMQARGGMDNGKERWFFWSLLASWRDGG